MDAIVKYFVVCTVLLGLVMKAVAADESSPNASSSQEAPTQSPIIVSLTKVRDLREQVLAIEEKATVSEGDTYHTLRLQSLEKNKQLVTELQELHILTNDFVAGGGNLNELLKPYESVVLRSGSSLRADIKNYLDHAKKDERELDTLSPDGLKEYKLDMMRVTTSIAVLDEYIGLVVAMEFDASPSQNFITEILPARLEYVAGHVNLSIEREAEIAQQIAIDKESIDLKSKQVLIEDKLRFDTQNLHQLMTVAEHYDIDITDYQSLLIRGSGEISTELLDVGVLKAFLGEWWVQAKFDLRNNLANYVLKFVIIIMILGFFRLLARAINHIIKRSVESGRLNLTVLMQDMLLTMINRFMLFIGLLVALSQLGIALGPVLAGLGVAGFIVGFALQDTLGNFASGMMILLCRPYDVGDVVEGGGVFGKVKSMSIVSTTILTFDNQTLIIPNSKIWGDVIKNVTAQKVRRVDMVFGVSYADSIPKVEAIIADVVASHEKVLKEPEPIIKLHTLGESSVDFIVRPWARTEDYWDVYWDITRAIKMRFDEEGVSIPFPQRDVHIYQNTPSQVPGESTA